MRFGLPQNTTRLLGVVVFLLIVPPFVKYAWFETWDYVGGDYEIFLKAAGSLSQGQSPYPPAVLGKAPGEAMGEAWGNYIYPPLFARLLYPFTYLPPVWGKKAYLVLCLIVYLAMLWPTSNRGYQIPGQRWAAYAILLGWGPVIHTFRHGQSDFIPLFLIILAWWVLGGGRLYSTGTEEVNRGSRIDLTAGVLLGIASMVKITPVLILPVFLVVLNWRLVAGFMMGAVMALVLSGPVTSWQYFTQVLPNMADFAGMRQCPSIHIMLVRLFDTLPVPSDWDNWWPWFAELVGVVITGVLYVWVLWYLFRGRDFISMPDLLLLACFLPPLFAGEVKHHYALAVLPILEAYRRLIPLCDPGPPLGPGDWNTWHMKLPSLRDIVSVWKRAAPPSQRLLALSVCLIPNFYYWDLFKLPIEALCPLDPSTLLVLGNIGAAIVVLPLFVMAETRDFENRSGTPPPA